MPTHISFRVQFDEKFFAFETQLSNLGPRECVDACVALEHHHPHVSGSQVQCHPFMVLCIKWSPQHLTIMVFMHSPTTQRIIIM